MENANIYSFPHTSKSQWLQVVLKELKTEPYSQMLLEIDGQQFDPYYTREEARHFQGIFPRFWSKMLAGENFAISDNLSPDALTTSVDQNMLSPLFELSNAEIDFDINAMLPNQCKPIFIGKNKNELKKIKEKLNNPSAIFILQGDISDPSFWHPIDINLNLSVEENTTILFDLMSKNLPFQGLFIQLNLSGELIKDVAKTRALKILWFNWLEKNKIEKSIFINAFKVLENDFPNQVIEQTVQCVIADCCQADRLQISTSSTNLQQANTLRHTYNVCNIESYIGNISDPIGGSYLWEFISEELARKAWYKYFEN